MGTPSRPKYILKRYMDPLGKKGPIHNTLQRTGHARGEADVSAAKRSDNVNRRFRSILVLEEYTNKGSGFRVPGLGFRV